MFYLCNPKGEKATPIYLYYYVKEDKKIFYYSTGQKVIPKNWDFENRCPKKKRGDIGIKLRHL